MVLQCKTPWFSYECPVPLQIKYTGQAIHMLLTTKWRVGTTVWGNKKASATSIQCLILHKKDLPAFNTHSNRILYTLSSLIIINLTLCDEITQNCTSYNRLFKKRSTLKIFIFKYIYCVSKNITQDQARCSPCHSLLLCLSHIPSVLLCC